MHFLHPDSGSDFFDRYYRQAVLFEIIGCILLFTSIGINYALGGHSPAAAHIFLTLPGVLLLIFGGSSARPHNMIRSFSSLVTKEPGAESAKGLLAALNHQKKIELVNRTIQGVYTAIEVYAASPDADQELLGQLREAADTRIKKKSL